LVNNPSHDASPPATATASAAEHRIVLSYAPADRRAGLAALLAYDETLAAILRSTRQPMIGQMRLTWWHDAVTSLAASRPPAEPVLRALASDVVPAVPAAMLTRVIEGWEELLDPDPLDAARLARYADGRGAGLFAAAAAMLGDGSGGERLAAGGRAWALSDLAANVSEAATATLATRLAEAEFAAARSAAWPRAQRPLGALMHLSAMPGASPPARAARALWHRLTGR